MFPLSISNSMAFVRFRHVQNVNAVVFRTATKEHTANEKSVRGHRIKDAWRANVILRDLLYSAAYSSPYKIHDDINMIEN
jgi:hypothetical protein